MLARLLIFVTVMLFGPLFIEVYLYHPLIALEHDPVAIVPRTEAALAVSAGFLVLAFDNKVTAILFGVVAAFAIAVGVIGTAIHLALHATSLAQLATDPSVWLGGPPPLVPLTFAASGCLGLIALAMPRQRPSGSSPVAIGRRLEGLAALCGLAAAIAGSFAQGGATAFMAVMAALALGTLGLLAEIVVVVFRGFDNRTA
jgi:hypothetical protein